MRFQIAPRRERERESAKEDWDYKDILICRVPPPRTHTKKEARPIILAFKESGPSKRTPNNVRWITVGLSAYSATDALWTSSVTLSTLSRLASDLCYADPPPHTHSQTHPTRESSSLPGIFWGSPTAWETEEGRDDGNHHLLSLPQSSQTSSTSVSVLAQF